MGLFVKILDVLKGTRCPGCGRPIQKLAKAGGFVVRQVDLDTGRVRMGVECRRCGTLHHYSCAYDSDCKLDHISQTCMKCGSKDFNEVPIEIRNWNEYYKQG